MKGARIWVDPSFRKKLKKDAADADQTLLEYTEGLARDASSINEKQKKRGNGIDFKLF